MDFYHNPKVKRSLFYRLPCHHGPLEVSPEPRLGPPPSGDETPLLRPAEESRFPPLLSGYAVSLTFPARVLLLEAKQGSVDFPLPNDRVSTLPSPPAWFLQKPAEMENLI